MGKYLIQVRTNDGSTLNIRTDPQIPDADDRNEGRDNVVRLDDVATINGTAWDGITPVVIENTPIAMATDPSTGVLEAPWFAVTIGKKSLLGDITETVGFISHSSATDAHITRLDDDSGIARAHRKRSAHRKNEYKEIRSSLLIK